MSTGADDIRLRIASVCASSPFELVQALEPFSFDRQPTGVIDGVFRLESESLRVLGGFNYSEERTDAMRLWVARKQQADPEGTYQRLQADARSLRAAVVRDGLQDGGDYGVPDAGDSVRITREAGKEYAVLQLTIPVVYEATV
jgi:hypothetical protein